MKIIKKVLVLGVAISCLMLSVPEILASSSAEIVNGMVNFRGEKEWQEIEDAPKLKIEIDDAYKLKGKQKTFKIKLNNSEWVEGRNTTMSIVESEGIAVYDGYVYVNNNTEADIVVSIPKDIGEGTKVTLQIPLLIRISDKIEDVSILVNELDEKENVIAEHNVAVGVSDTKKLQWKVGEVPDIYEKGNIAPLSFEETRIGSLGTREAQIVLELKSRYFQFEEPQYESKQVNSDDIDYIVPIDEYLEYSGGFSKEDQRLKITINKEGTSMKIKLQGSIPSAKGIMTLKNISVIGDERYAEDGDIKLLFQSEDILANNQEAVVGHFTKKQEEANTDNKTDETAANEEEEKAENETKPAVEKKNIIFKVGEAKYEINGQKYEMDGKTYVKNPGYVMVPLRYVTQALGTTKMVYENGRVSFEYQGEEIILTVGSKAVIIGNQIKEMSIALESTNNRVYVPIGEIANLLGVQKEWNQQTQSACFYR